MTRVGLTILFILSFCLIGMSQPTSQWDKTIFAEVAPNSTQTITLNLNSYTQNQIGALKDGLISFDEKVELVLIKDKLRKMYITYNNAMLLEDLIAVFEENGFAYLLEDRKSSIKNKAEEL